MTFFKNHSPFRSRIFPPQGVLHPCVVMVLGALAAFILFMPPAPAYAQDCWLSPHGAGQRNGTSPENAYAASEDARGRSAEKCWADTSADGTMFVLEGRYAMSEGTFWDLKISRDQGGPKEAPSIRKKLIGLGHVSIIGSRQIPYTPAIKESGETWLEIKKGAHQLHVENFDISRVAIGILADGGNNHDLSFKDLHFEDTRQNLVLYGHPDCRSKAPCKGLPKGSVSRRILIEKVDGLRYSKRHVRLTHGVSEVLVLKSSADSQFLDGDFAVGFDVESPSHDIEFRECVARGNLYTDPVYWNGDGFKSEQETENIRWIKCAAMDNADAGFDIKSPAAVLDQIHTFGNSRNIRIWSLRESQLTHVVSTYARTFGGKGTPAGLWVQGIASCQDCTLFANPTQIHLESDGKPSRLTLLDTFVSAEKDEILVTREENAELQTLRTEMYQGDRRVEPIDAAAKTQEPPSDSRVGT